MKKYIILFLLMILSSSAFAYEDLTTFTATNISTTSTTATWGGGEPASLYKDYGVDYFTGDFIIQFQFNASYVSGASSYRNVILGLTDYVPATTEDLLTEDEGLTFGITSTAGVRPVWLYNFNGDDVDSNNNDDLYDKEVYATMIRESGEVTIYLYSDSARTTLIDSFTVSCSDSFRYLSAYGVASGWEAYAKGTTSNILLQGGDDTAPVLSNPTPSSNLAAHTTETTMGIDTNENATCKYSTDAGTPFYLMDNVFTTTGGTGHSVTVTGLETNATPTDHEYYIRCSDADINWNTSDYNLTITVDADTTPPSDITDLEVDSCDQSSCDLSWTAVGDDGAVGTAASYDVRYSTSAITSGNWASATPATGEPDPAVSGSAETFTVTDLDPDTTYYFAITATDIAGNTNDVSTDDSGTTDDVAADYIKIWVANSHDKVTRDELRLNESQDVTSNIWDGTNVSIFGAKNEVVSFQTIIEVPLKTSGAVTIDFDTLTHADTSTIETTTPATGEGVFDYTDRDIENFYVRYLQIIGMSELQSGPCKYGYDERACYKDMKRPDNNGSFAYLDLCTDDAECRAGDQTAWADRPNADKYYPEILIPLELESGFTITKNRNQSIWTDIYIPDDASTGDYTGNLVVSIGGTPYKTIPITLEVKSFSLPDTFQAKSWTYLSDEDLWQRHFGQRYPEWANELGGEWNLRDDAIVIYRNLFKLFKRNRQSATIGRGHQVLEWIENDSYVEGTVYDELFSGSLFTSTYGYDGPGYNTPTDVHSIYTYGTSTYILGRSTSKYYYNFVKYTGTGTIPDNTSCTVGGYGCSCLHQDSGTYETTDGYQYDVEDGWILVNCSGKYNSYYTNGMAITDGTANLTIEDSGQRYYSANKYYDGGGIIPDGASCSTDGGSTTMTCVYHTGTEIYVEDISGGTVDNGDIITDGTYSLTVSDTDGASTVYARSAVITEYNIQHDSDVWEAWFKTNYPSIERFYYLVDEPYGAGLFYFFNRYAKWINEGTGTGNTMKSLITCKLSERADYAPHLEISFDMPGVAADEADAKDWAVTNNKDIWSYNGMRPNDGTFVTEDAGTALLAKEWGAFKHDVSRVFWWCGNCWKNPSYSSYETDVFNTAQTFGRHALGNGTACSTTSRGGCCQYNSGCGNGDGVFIYPATDKYVRPDVFTGSGLNDLTAGGANTEVSDENTYTIIIDAEGTPDTFKWRENDGSWTETVAITGSSQTLDNGVTISFAATTGHTLGDQWEVTTHKNYGLRGFFSSVRMKNWRDGLQQREYLYLAEAEDEPTVSNLVDTMVPEITWEHDVINPADPSYWWGGISWLEDPDTWEDARSTLADIIEGKTVQVGVRGLSALKNIFKSVGNFSRIRNIK